MAGEITDTQLLELARSDDAEKQREQLCEAYFYIGSAKLIGGDKAEAISYFTKSVNTNMATFDEHRSAKAELARLK